MKYNLQNGKIEIHFIDILENLTLEEKQEMAKDLVWDRDMFADLVERIATDKAVTFNVNHHIHDARMRLLELLPAMTQEIIRTLVTEMKRNHEECRRLNNWAWHMWAQWPKELINLRPELEQFKIAPLASDADINPVLALIESLRHGPGEAVQS